MVAEARTFTDVESAVREWTRDSVPSVARRAFFGRSDSATDPQVSLFLVSGPGANEVYRIQFGVYASHKAAAADVVAELATAAEAMSRYEHDGTLLHGAAVDSIRWQPDPASDHPKYLVDVIVAATAL